MNKHLVEFICIGILTFSVGALTINKIWGSPFAETATQTPDVQELKKEKPKCETIWNQEDNNYRSAYFTIEGVEFFLPNVGEIRIKEKFVNDNGDKIVTYYVKGDDVLHRVLASEFLMLVQCKH
jgi:hypothetical protein